MRVRVCICLYELVVRTQFTYIYYVETSRRCHHTTLPRSATADARSSKNTAWMKLVVRAKYKKDYVYVDSAHVTCNKTSQNTSEICREDIGAWVRDNSQETKGCSIQPQLCCGEKHGSRHQTLDRSSSVCVLSHPLFIRVCCCTFSTVLLLSNYII